MENKAIDEKAVIARAQRGDTNAFGTLVRVYQRRAYAAAYGVVGNRDDALELAQEAFIRAFRAIGRFDAKLPFYPWLHRIVRNTCLNHLKQRKRRGESSLESLTEDGFEFPETTTGPEEAAELASLRDAIRKAMGGLTPPQREILELRHLLELSYSEISEQLGVPIGTVMSRLHGARKAMRLVLEEAGMGAVNVP